MEQNLIDNLLIVLVQVLRLKKRRDLRSNFEYEHKCFVLIRNVCRVIIHKKFLNKLQFDGTIALSTRNHLNYDSKENSSLVALNKTALMKHLTYCIEVQ